MTLKNTRLARAEELSPEIMAEHNLPEKGLVVIESHQFLNSREEEIKKKFGELVWNEAVLPTVQEAIKQTRLSTLEEVFSKIEELDKIHHDFAPQKKLTDNPAYKLIKKEIKQKEKEYVLDWKGKFLINELKAENPELFREMEEHKKRGKE